MQSSPQVLYTNTECNRTIKYNRKLNLTVSYRNTEFNRTDGGSGGVTSSSLTAILKKKLSRHTSFAPRSLQNCSKDSYDGTEKTSLLYDQENVLSLTHEHTHTVFHFPSNASNTRQKIYSAV